MNKSIYLSLTIIILFTLIFSACNSDSINESNIVEIKSPKLMGFTSPDSIINVAVNKTINHLKSEKLEINKLYISSLENYDSMILIDVSHQKAYEHAHEMTKNNKSDGWVVYPPMSFEDSSHLYLRHIYYYVEKDSIYDPVKITTERFKKGRVEGNPEIYIAN
ncbi:hypothetical protein [Marinigracilibium pacificum]|uniref:Lipoprotein n=1 Tax=Marinigracilibium pacificum TaxID=2729599 RepID=A0A848IXY4_9BACT|nr:hypothetical protein [Marinigracilibium pacificum]NMM48145.1 hypothetical protein [Marinigracilibium pacificum]